MPRFTTSDGVGISYTDEGAGPPLLCLAGITRNGRDFDWVVPHLTGRRVIRPDYRGRGASDWADPATYTIPVEARDVVELLDHLGLASVPILGTSRGGLVAMVLAAAAKSRLSGVCLNDVGPVIAEAGLDAVKAYLGRNPSAKTYAEMAQVWESALPGFQNVPPGRWEDEARRRYEETPEGLKINYDPRLRDAVLGQGAQPVPDLWPFFDAFSGLPLALIRGANSDLLSAETAAEMRRRRPDMIYAEVPYRGHVPFLDEPEAVDAIHRWLEACQ